MNNKKQLTIQELTFLICGKTVENAKEILEKHSYIMRITDEDGQKYMITMDHRPNRVNVEVKDGIVTAVLNIG